MPDRTETAVAPALRRSGKAVDDEFGYTLVRPVVVEKSKAVLKKATPTRPRVPVKKSAEPFLLDVVVHPDTEFTQAVSDMSTRLAQQRPHGSALGVLVLPRGTREWRMAKEIAAAAREGVYVRVSPLIDLNAGAQRIQAQMLKDRQRHAAHLKAYTASVQKNPPPGPAAD